MGSPIGDGFLSDKKRNSKSLKGLLPVIIPAVVAVVVVRLIQLLFFLIFGSFDETNLDDELNMIDVNVKALHILTKLYLKDMKKRDSGTILNVASSAAFFPGPLLSSYYASKSYVYKLSLAINEELNRCKSNVKISVIDLLKIPLSPSFSLPPLNK